MNDAESKEAASALREASRGTVRDGACADRDDSDQR